MPLVYQQNINETTKLGVWHIKEQKHFSWKRLIFSGRSPIHINVYSTLPEGTY